MCHYKRISVVLLLLIITLAFASILLTRPVAFVHTDINIFSGDIRSQCYIGPLLVKESTEITEFSTLVRKHLGQPTQRSWKRDHTRTYICKCFRHGEYAGAIGDCKEFSMLMEIYEVPEEQVKVMLKQALNALQQNRKTFETRINEWTTEFLRQAEDEIKDGIIHEGHKESAQNQTPGVN